MKRSLLTIAVLFFVGSPLHAGVVFEVETRDHEQSPPSSETSQVAVEGRSLTMNVGSGGNRKVDDQMIFHGERREMIMVDHQRKTFMVMDAQAMQAMVGQLKQMADQARVQMEQMLQGVPAEQRAMLEKRMKEQMPAQQAWQRPRPVIRKVGDRAKMHGYPCVLFEVVRDGRKIRDLWVTDWSNIEGGRELAPIFNDMSDFFRTLTESMPQMGGKSGALNDNIFASIKELGGFPVASRDYAEDGTIESESALRSSKRQRLDPAAFEPPAGYKRQEMFGGR